MQEAIRFMLLGLGLGALYALGAQGLIVIYRGSGVLNFALGAIGIMGAYLEWELTVNYGWAFVPALLVGVAFSAAIGVMSQLCIMRPLRRASPLVRVIATLGLLSTFQAIVVLKYGTSSEYVPSKLPTSILRIHGGIFITEDRVILLTIAVVLTGLLTLLYRRTKFGLGTTAVAENERAAAAIGWSPNRIAALNWGLGSGLAGLAAILIVPITTLQATTMTNLIIACLAAALVASFRSFGIALVAGLLVGVLQSELTRYVTQPGVAPSAPFVVVIIILVVRGRSLPMRDYLEQRLPAVGDGRFRWGWALAGIAVVAIALATTSPTWVAAITMTFGYAIILLSVVVLTGYTGQLSLAQFAMAGFGAWVAGRLAAADGLPFWAVLPIGAACTVLLGGVLAIPAIRTRGINLAIITLGLASAIEQILFDNPSFTGGASGTIVKSPEIFGWNVNGIEHPFRYGMVVLVIFAFCAWMTGNVRRGRSGRRLIAVRTNERAASALGVRVPQAKLYGFALAAGLAGVGGILLSFQSTAIDYTTYTSFTSVSLVGFALIGGLGFLMGAPLGAALAAGALGSAILDSISANVGQYITLISGLSILVLVLLNQNGVAASNAAVVQLFRRRFGESVGRHLAQPRGWLLRGSPRATPLGDAVRAPVQARELTVRDLSVKYGGNTAVHGVSLTVRPGEIVGLIGPNGAGKTSLIDAVTGFTPASSGTIEVGGVTVTGMSVVGRVRAGVGRSFQSLELFEDSTVLDNLRIASDPSDLWAYVADLVHPRNPPLSGAVQAAIREFQLGDLLHRHVQDLSYGQRRLLAIARTVASSPSVLLLDEPAAGLGEQESAELATLVQRLARELGMAVLLIEHDMNFVMSICDQLVVLDFGHKIAEGTPETVQSDPSVIAAYLGQEIAPEASAAITGGGA